MSAALSRKSLARLVSESSDREDRDPALDAIAGADFLHHFVKDTCWAHLDLASIDHFDKGSGLTPEFSSGAATRIFIVLARGIAQGTKVTERHFPPRSSFCSIRSSSLIRKS